MKRTLAPYNGGISENPRYLLIPTCLRLFDGYIREFSTYPSWETLFNAVYICKSTMLSYNFSFKRRSMITALCFQELLKGIYPMTPNLHVRYHHTHAATVPPSEVFEVPALGLG